MKSGRGGEGEWGRERITNSQFPKLKTQNSKLKTPTKLVIRSAKVELWLSLGCDRIDDLQLENCRFAN
ncbi:MAG: hypothetical protein HC786_22245 [Richelia sp. CSU_2_1]|nr:hypothetical protein [Microcoleus sp. SU_5_6]NJL66326.1 hypothetical protein [Microcoleus sp. SM1_3_4]NJR24679.1 hypothetical protein [Richelia sp. CSU_2_1]